MTTIKFKDDSFISVVSLLKDITENVTITFSDDSVYISVIDVTCVYLCKIYLVEIFETVTLDEPIKIRVNTEELLNMLKCKEKNETLKIEIGGGDDINIIFTNKKNSKSFSKYNLKLLYLDEEEEDFEEFEMDDNVVIDFESKKFSKLCKRIAKFDESMRIICNEGDDILQFNTGNNNKISMNLTRENGVKSMTIKQDISSKLLSKYLLAFSKADAFSDSMRIVFDDEQAPVLLDYKVDTSSLKFYVCPQLKEE